METKFNFKSAICTSRSQSERLLALGLKKETADMCSVIDHVSNGSKWEEVDTIFSFTPDDWNFRESVTPRWSLHRLWCLLPHSITIVTHFEYGRQYRVGLDLTMDSYQNVSYLEGVDEPCYDKSFFANDAYESICKAIEWLIKEGYFNKEYLEE